jgi:hypothetical protein
LNAQYHNGLLTATANTVSTVVARDASGNFSAGTITATLSGVASSSNLLNALGNYVWSASTLPTGYNTGIQCSFVQGSNGWQNYGSVMNMMTYSGGGGSLQLFVPYSPTYGGTGLQVRFGNYDVSSGNSWTSWKTLLASDNYGGYSTFSGTVQGTTFTSTVSTGTAPFTVTSTTQVSNLNAQYHNGLLTATANTVSTVVARDASGNFSAGTITATLSGSATYLSGTNQGLTGNQSLRNVSATTDWANMPIGYSAMFTNNQTATGTPSTNYGYFIKIANRDGGGGWGGLWSDYSGGDTYIGNTTVSTSYATWYKLLSANNYSSYAIARGGDVVSSAIQFQSNLGATSGALSAPPLQAYSTGNNSAFMSFHKGGNYAVNMGLDSDNVLRIGGWSASANRFQMDMSGNLTMAGTVTASSDIRLKDNIEIIQNGLEKVLSLNGVTFTRKDQEDKTKIHVGLIAQEVEEVIPEIVSEDNLGMKSVAYGNIVAVLIEAIKEQQIQIDTLRKEVEDLKNK